ncbi:glycosyltransferase family 2 protein [Brumicola nitratireducens]|uniref:Glycosyl transferase family protein n=1 Tax=Glaciecola nitratireducens (strain JCM 12485 / KCTC 12276 / FR1064) TaxID=1085623 RepID=G4QIR2_GLANF|nr:glycosyltransferase [Glaciecola nitratireducens]AEP31217.1 glycosyl transferase family protein [Glaciecola nitratireducens FR1064]
MLLRGALQRALGLFRLVLHKLPMGMRQRLRQQHSLMSLYSKALHTSRLFYGTLPEHKQQARYEKLILLQQQALEQQEQALQPDALIDCLVLNPSMQDLPMDTLKSLQDIPRVRHIYLVNANSGLNTADISQFNKTRILPLHTHTELDHALPLLLLRAGEVLHQHAVAAFLTSGKNSNGVDVVTCDSDTLHNELGRTQPQCYPQWDPDLQLSSGYMNTGICLFAEEHQRSIINFIAKETHAAAYALWLVTVYTNESDVATTHLPFSLLHRKTSYPMKWSDALNESGILIPAKLEITAGKISDTAVIRWPLASQPLVSIIIPTRNGKALVDTCIASILRLSEYRNFEILLVDNNSDEPESLAFFNTLAETEDKVRLLQYPYEFNYSAINNFAVAHAKGSVYAFVNNDIEVISTTWLGDMLMHVMRHDIGCVGAKLYYANRRVQHAGVVLGYGGGAGHAHKYFPHYHAGYLNRLIVTHHFSAVTAACLLIKKEDFVAVKGFNEQDLAVAFNDVDLCLKVQALGRRNLYCAEAELYHHESVSRGTENTPEKRSRFERELVYLQDTWPEYIAQDPGYNCNLTLRQENFALREV